MNYFDLHCDTAYECFVKNQSFCCGNTAITSDSGRCFEQWYQTFAVWIKDDLEKPYEFYKAVLNDFKQKLLKKCDNLTPLFAVEGGAVIGKDANRIYELHNDGIKFLTLTWNGENRIAGGAKSDAGLTHFGKKVIEKMNETGMVCDVSHLNDKSFFKVIELADRVVATHSNCRSICDNPRNLTDEQLVLIRQKGGLVGICFYPKFLGCNVYDTIYQNICHMLDLELEDHIAIGSDFDGAEMDNCLDSPLKVPALYDFLWSRGIDKCLLDKIFFKNAYNYARNL